MPAQVRTCVKCYAEFVLLPGKPGLSTHCPPCSEETTEMVMAKVAWEGKHTQVIEITDNRKEAERFNKVQNRGSFGPLSTFGGKGEGTVGKESGKIGSGAELGAVYNSPLKEKHSLKR